MSSVTTQVWASASPPELLAPAGVPTASAKVGIGGGPAWPLVFDGLPLAAAGGASIGAGNVAAVRYGSS